MRRLGWGPRKIRPERAPAAPIISGWVGCRAPVPGCWSSLELSGPRGSEKMEDQFWGSRTVALMARAKNARFLPNQSVFGGAFWGHFLIKFGHFWGSDPPTQLWTSPFPIPRVPHRAPTPTHPTPTGPHAGPAPPLRARAALAGRNLAHFYCNGLCTRDIRETYARHPPYF